MCPVAYQSLKRVLLGVAVLTLCLLCLPVGSAVAERRAVVRVREGDTLVRIAKRTGTSVSALKRINRLDSNLIRVGQRLRLPTRRRPRHRAESRKRSVHKQGTSSDIRARHRSAKKDSTVSSEQTKATRETQQAVRARRQRLGSGDRSAAARLLQKAAPERWQGIVDEAVAQLPSLNADVKGLESRRHEGTLRSPVPGGVLARGWGSGRGGYHLALDIAAEAGAPILAVEAGVVIYAGRGFRGFGRIIVVLHRDGFVSGYAHNRRNRVTAGELVARGEHIADLGSSGRAHGPHLHFMFLHRGRYCDAEPLLRPQVRNSDAAPRVWIEKAPQSVRCRARSLRSKKRKRNRRR